MPTEITTTKAYYYHSFKPRCPMRSALFVSNTPHADGASVEEDNIAVVNAKCGIGSSIGNLADLQLG